MPPLCQADPHASLIQSQPWPSCAASRRAMTGVAVMPWSSTDTMIVKATVDHSHGSSGTCSWLDGVGQVVERPDAADAEERDGRHLAAVEPAVERARRGRSSPRRLAGERAYDEDEREGDDDAAPVEVLEQALASSPCRGRAARAASSAARAARRRRASRAGRSGRGARRAGSSRTRRPRGSRSRRRAPRRRTPPAARPAPASARRGRPGGACRCGTRKAWRPSSQPTARPTSDAERDLADDVPAEPGARVREAEAAGEEEQRQVHEGEGEPVVEPGLGGEREADVVVLVAAPRRPRPRRRRRPRSAARRPARRRRARGRSGRARHPAAARPPAPARPPTSRAAPCRAMVSGMVTSSSRHTGDHVRHERHDRGSRGAVDGQADAHQRDQHGELGDVRDQVAVVLRVEADASARGSRPMRHAERDEHHRRGDGRSAGGWGRTIASSSERPSRK